jgi:beta-phosphoglucomutase-like phosphatase (HAD superfamily)
MGRTGPLAIDDLVEVGARPDFEELLQRIHDIKTRNYQRLLAAGAIPLRADIGQLICDARTEGVRLAIASSSKLGNVVGLLRANLGPNADTWFDAIASGSVAAAKKPSPDIYLWTLKQLNLRRATASPSKTRPMAWQRHWRRESRR